MKANWLVALGLLALALPACDSGSGAGSSSASSKPAATNANTVASAATAATATVSATSIASSAPAASGTTKAGSGRSASAAASAVPAIGVSECDDYIKLMHDCFLPKQSPGARTTEDEVLGQKIEAWTKAAATDQGKGGLAKVCKQEADMWKNKLAGAGCKMP